LGDIVICLPLVQREAAEQDKTRDAHLAHLVVHGTLHLLGFSHGDAESARSMEELEVKILGELGIPDPYAADAVVSEQRC
ncbi:MAG: rRNA maturation RNase YbeY, partial [Gammaproteobacteria bacterium]